MTTVSPKDSPKDLPQDSLQDSLQDSPEHRRGDLPEHRREDRPLLHGQPVEAPVEAQGDALTDNELLADDGPTMVRSFLGRSLRSSPEVEVDDRSFRPFLVTGGRTTSELPLDFEAMVTPTPAGLCADLRFEQRTILDRCIQHGAQSIAELAAYLKLPIGTVRVVAADLVSSHLLDVHSPDRNLSNDVLMLKRLINGVRAL